jgi:hypothetical protein
MSRTRPAITLRLADHGAAEVEIDGQTLELDLRRHARGWRVESLGYHGDGPGRANINRAMVDAADDLAAVARGDAAVQVAGAGIERPSPPDRVGRTDAPPGGISHRPIAQRAPAIRKPAAPVMG